MRWSRRVLAPSAALVCLLLTTPVAPAVAAAEVRGGDAATTQSDPDPDGRGTRGTRTDEPVRPSRVVPRDAQVASPDAVARPETPPVAVEDDRVQVVAGSPVEVAVLANDRGVAGLALDVLPTRAGVTATVTPRSTVRIALDPESAPESATVVYTLSRAGQEVARARVLVTRRTARAGTPARGPVGADLPQPRGTEPGAADAGAVEPGAADAEAAEPEAAGPGAAESTGSGPAASGRGSVQPRDGQPDDDPSDVGTPDAAPSGPGESVTRSAPGARLPGVVGPRTAREGRDRRAGDASGAGRVDGEPADERPRSAFDLDLDLLAPVDVSAAVAGPVDDTAATPAGVPVTVDVLANDEADGLVLGSVTRPRRGQAEVRGGAVTYTPDAGFQGVDSFAYTLVGGPLPVQATVTVHVLPAGPGPVAVDDTAVTVVDRPVLIAVSRNDRPRSGAVAVVAGPQAGAAVVDGGAVRYVPRAGFAGADSFRYSLTTDQGVDEALVEVQVVPAATAVADVAFTTVGTPISVDVRRNDLGAQDLRVVLLDAPPAGVTTVEPSGLIRYVPEEDDPDVRIRYGLAADDAGRHVLDSAVLRVRVAADPPPAYVAVDDTFVVPVPADGEPVVLDVLANDVLASDDVDLQHGSVSCPRTATCDLAATPRGRFSLFSEGLRAGDVVGFDYLLVADPDSTGSGDTARVRVQVLGDDPRPRAVDDQALVPAGGSVVVDLLANDTVPADHEAVLVPPVEGGPPVEGSVSLDDGELTYTAPVVVRSPVQTFTYRLQRLVEPDSVGLLGSEAGTAPAATVTVLVVTPRPVDDEYELDHGAGSALLDVLANDVAPDGARVRLVDGPARGEVEALGRAFAYVPDDLPAGTDSFVYELVLPRIEADDLVLGRARVTVVVRRAEARPDTAEAVPGEPVPIDVLANDVGTEGRLVRVPEGGDPSAGDADVGEDGVITYTMDPGFRGPVDVFTYELGVIDLRTRVPVFGPESRTTVTVRRVLPPGAPVVTAEPGDGSATVRWTAPSTTGGLPVTAYQVTWAPVGQPPAPGAVLTLSPTATEAVVRGLANGTAYTVAVSAVSRAGVGEPGRVQVVPRTVPGAPLALRAVPGQGLVVLDWLPPASDGGSPVSGYRVTWGVPGPSSPGGGGRRAAAVPGSLLLPATARQAVVDDLPDGAALRFEVAALNAAGPGVPAAVVAEPGRELADAVAYTTAQRAVVLDVVPGDLEAGVTLVVDDPAEGAAEALGADGVRFVPDGRFQQVTLDYRLLYDGVELTGASALVREVDAVDDTAQAPRGRSLVVDVTANDLAPTGVTVAVTPSTGGSAVVEGEDVRFTPVPGFEGTATFSYDLLAPGADGPEVVDSADVVVEVGPRPDAVDDDAATRAGVPVEIPVLANDIAADGLEVQLRDVPAGPAPEVTPAGAVRYRPADDASGLLEITYALVERGTDGEVVEHDRAVVRVQVAARPVARDDEAVTSVGAPVVVDVRANDDGDEGLDVELLGSSPAGVTEVVGGIRVVPPASAAGTTVTFDYGLVEAGAVLDTAVVRVRVRALPVPQDGDGSGSGGGGGRSRDDDSSGFDDDSSGVDDGPSEDPGGPGAGGPEPGGPEPGEPEVRPLSVSVPTASPGSTVTLSGAGCAPGQAVLARVGDALVATVPAGADGFFRVDIKAPGEIGRHRVSASCGDRVFDGSLDVVLTTHHVAAGTAPAAGGVIALMLAFYLLSGSVLAPRGTTVDASPPVA